MDLTINKNNNNKRPRPNRRASKPPINKALDHDVLSKVLSLLDCCLDLLNCSLVCKPWCAVITQSRLLEELYYNKWQMGLVKGLGLEEMASEPHRLGLVRSRRIDVDQWKGHSVAVTQCRKKNSLLLTGGGDKVMRLWSLEDSRNSVYKSLGAYRLPLENGPLVDFDFDESKIVGLLGSKSSRLCIWRRDGFTRLLKPEAPGGLCVRYSDPEAVVGCADGTARVFDMYSGRCSRILRMNTKAPVTCLELSEYNRGLFILGAGGTSITMSSVLSSDQSVARLRTECTMGSIKTLCFNPSDDRMVFIGTASGYVLCWDLKTMGLLWHTQVIKCGAVCSMQHLKNDASTLIVGGSDGVLCLVDQKTGDVISRIVLDTSYCTYPISNGSSYESPVQRLRGRRLSPGVLTDDLPTPPITCVAVGMKKIITTHNRDYIRTWKFN